MTGTVQHWKSAAGVVIPADTYTHISSTVHTRSHRWGSTNKDGGGDVAACRTAQEECRAAIIFPWGEVALAQKH